MSAEKNFYDCDYLEYLKDPYHVWNFQKYFGVEIVNVIENEKGVKFQVKNIDDVRKKIEKTPQVSNLSSDEDYISSSGK